MNVEHYIVSSGITEIIEGTDIHKYFKKIYGCNFLYDDKTKEAIWPAMSINYTMKELRRLNREISVLTYTE